MARRGDVLSLRRSLGFGAPAKLEHFVVVQSTQFLTDFETHLAIPLVEPLDGDEADPLAVPVQPSETGAKGERYALTWLLRAVRVSDFAEGTSGRLKAATLRRVDEALRLLLDVPSAR
jgi:hypothetical protein